MSGIEERLAPLGLLLPKREPELRGVLSVSGEGLPKVLSKLLVPKLDPWLGLELLFSASVPLEPKLELLKLESGEFWVPNSGLLELLGSLN